MRPLTLPSPQQHSSSCCINLEIRLRPCPLPLSWILPPALLGVCSSRYQHYHHHYHHHYHDYPLSHRDRGCQHHFYLRGVCCFSAQLRVWWIPKSSSSPVIKLGAHVIAFGVTNLGVVLVPYPPSSEVILLFTWFSNLKLPSYKRHPLIKCSLPAHPLALTHP